MVCYAETVPAMGKSVFGNTTGPISGILYVPSEAYKNDEQWAVWGSISIMHKCAPPSITWRNGEFVFSCETANSNIHYTLSLISQSSQEGVISNGKGVSSSPNYIVSMFATAEGYCQSDIVNQTIAIPSYPIGDIDGNGSLTITDVSRLVNLILEK